MADLHEWALLAYRLPRQPSGPRVTIWRKLRRLGVVQLVDGLVALPAGSQNREQLDWLAEEIIEADGEAWTWLGTPGSKAQQRALEARMKEAAAAGYQAVIDEAEQARPDGRTLERLRRELRTVEARDPFNAKDRGRARRAVERVAAAVDEQRALR
jgi:hypothetical protein